MSHPSDLPPEFVAATRALQEHRPQMTDFELACVKRRLLDTKPRMRAAPTRRPGIGFLRSRLAITALLATGALMSSSGVALGISALSTTTVASSAQYGTPAAIAGSSGGQVLSAGASGPSGVDDDQPASDAGTLGRSVAGSVDAGATQAVRQLGAAESAKLPFTGYASIPILLIGLALLMSGVVLRHAPRGRLRT